MSAEARAPAERSQTAWFCAGNADDRLTTLALESLLTELASHGASPLAVYSHTAPFSTAPLRLDGRDRLARSFEHYTRLRIPAIRLEELCRLLANPRRRAAFAEDGARYSPILVSGPAVPEEGLPSVADAVVLLAAKGTSTASWVYQAARNLAAKSADLPVSIVVMNAAHLEEAAVFYQDVREEVVSLLGRELSIGFAGFLRFEPDYADLAVKNGVSLVEGFPSSPIHGQIKYVLKALTAAVAAKRPAQPYFDRMAALISGAEWRPVVR